MIIYLGWLLPATSSDLPKAGGPRKRFCSVLLRMGFTYALPVTSEAVVSYTALPTLPHATTAMCRVPCGGIFLLHYPWSRLHRTLSGILPCEARTFLTPAIKPGRDHLSYLFLILYNYSGVKSSVQKILTNKFYKKRLGKRLLHHGNETQKSWKPLLNTSLS